MLREIRIEPRHDPAHAWAEYAVACITHLKVEPEKLKRHPIQPNAGPAVRLEVIALDDKLISKILVSPLPDLKASDMLYFLIARHGNLTLVTEDRRLRNVSMNGGVRALSLKSALAHIREENE
jgi:rRNA-processing protein FCF1